MPKHYNNDEDKKSYPMAPSHMEKGKTNKPSNQYKHAGTGKWDKLDTGMEHEY